MNLEVLYRTFSMDLAESTSKHKRVVATEPKGHPGMASLKWGLEVLGCITRDKGQGLS